LVGLGTVVGVLFAMRQSESEPAVENTVAAESATEVVEADADETAVRMVVVDDDGKSLWVSPTAGVPISLSYLPHGTQLVLHVRPAELLAHAEGEKVLAALGPWGEEVVALVEQQIGVPLADVEALTVAVHPTLSGELHTTWRLRLAKPASDWQTSTASDERESFFPAAEQGNILVSCLAGDVAELREQGTAPALFPRDMQRLVDRTDDSRTATLVFSPRFLQTDGHKLLAGGAKQLETVLAEMAGAKATAVALSAHWDEDFFLELQSTVTLDQPPHRFGSNVQRWLPRAVVALESAIHADPGHPYGREIIRQFPAMLRYLSKYTRSEEVDGVSVLRCYLPTVAGHNLLMAAELVLNQSESTAQADGMEIESPPTVEEKLLQVTSLSFPKETLERALEILAEDLGVKIEIAGRDLQLEGITKNQSFGIDLRDKRAGEILLAVLRLANPDRTADSLADAKQKLVYVLREDANGGLGAIVVTTRAAAIRRGDPLPDVFLPKSVQE
jgi:hypothetical protein